MHNLCFIHNSGVYFIILSFLLQITIKFFLQLIPELQCPQKNSAGLFALWHLKCHYLKVNNKWDRMWKEVIIPNVRYYPSIYLEVL
jgi:hypothetical protein